MFGKVKAADVPVGKVDPVAVTEADMRALVLGTSEPEMQASPAPVAVTTGEAPVPAAVTFVPASAPTAVPTAVAPVPQTVKPTEAAAAKGNKGKARQAQVAPAPIVVTPGVDE